MPIQSFRRAVCGIRVHSGVSASSDGSAHSGVSVSCCGSARSGVSVGSGGSAHSGVSVSSGGSAQSRFSVSSGGKFPEDLERVKVKKVFIASSLSLSLHSIII